MSLAKYPDWIDGHNAREKGLPREPPTDCEFPDDFTAGWDAMNFALDDYVSAWDKGALYVDSITITN